MTRQEISDAHARMLTGLLLAFFILTGICLYIPEVLSILPRLHGMFGNRAEQAAFFTGLADMSIVCVIGFTVPVLIVGGARDAFQG